MKDYQNKEKLSRLLEKHKTYKEVSEILGVKDETIRKWAKKFGICKSVGSQGARKHTVNKDFFENIDTEEKAYWLGFIMADGCIYRGNDPKSYRLQINLSSKDKDHLIKFNNAIESDYLIRESLINNRKTSKEYNAVQLQIYCTKMCHDLIRHNVIPRKSLVCKMPDLKYNLIRHYIRGYFDGDGCISHDNKGRWTIDIVGGNNMLLFFKNYLKSIGIKTGICNINHSSAKDMYACDRHMIIKIFDLLYKNATVFLDRKYDKFQEFVKYMSRQIEISGQ